MAWIETPKRLAIVLALTAVVAAWTGYGIAQAPSRVIVVVVQR